MKEISVAGLHAMHTADIVRRLDELLVEVYELDVPDPAPDWDPPDDEEFSAARGVYECDEYYGVCGRDDDELEEEVSIRQGVPAIRAAYDLGMKDAGERADYYEKKCKEALEMCGKLRNYAVKLHDAFDDRTDYSAVVDDLGKRAKRLREDLGL
jgi:hypothetical protein